MLSEHLTSGYQFPALNLGPSLDLLGGSVRAAGSTTAHWKEISEIVKNVAQALAIFGGLFALLNWLKERRNRAIDVLADLEKRFTRSELGEARALVEADAYYKIVAPAIAKCVLATLAPQKNSPPTDTEAEALIRLDKLLRFYVYLRGVQNARQVPDDSLRACYRYWLTFYFHPKRTAFRAYVDWFFPTVHFWLRDDEAKAAKRVWWQASAKQKRFFTPTEFG